MGEREREVESDTASLCICINMVGPLYDWECKSKLDSEYLFKVQNFIFTQFLVTTERNRGIYFNSFRKTEGKKKTV